MKCIICGNALSGCICPRCCFDLSLCSEQYPTLTEQTAQSRAVSAMRDELYRELLELRAGTSVLGSAQRGKADAPKPQRKRPVAPSGATVAGGYGHTVGLRADGTVCAVGDDSDGQCNVGDWSDIVAIAAGSTHTFGLRADRTVCAVGENDKVQNRVDGWTDICLPSSGKHKE